MKVSATKLKAIWFLILLFISATAAVAQTGTPYLTHFKLPSGLSSQNWAFEQDGNGLMYVLNRKGIYSFDGMQWTDMEVSGRPLAIAYQKSLFYCSDKGVGHLVLEANGTFRQKILLSTKDGDVFYGFFKTDSGLLAVSPQVICEIKVGNEIGVDTLFVNRSNQVFISDVFKIKDQLFHVRNRALVYLNKPRGGVELVSGLPIGDDFTFSFPLDNKIFFGTTSNKLYSFNGLDLKQVKIKDQRYLTESVLNGGKAISKDLIALSTLNGGCILLNPITGETSTTLNFFNGLPDDEVFSLGTDRDGGLWISHGMGITRADLIIPLRNFGFYPGLKGNYFSSLYANRQLYVGSSEGLFTLVESKKFKAVEVEVKSKSTTEAKSISDANATQALEEQQLKQTEVVVEQKKKSFLSRIFSGKSERKVSDDNDRSISIEASSVSDLKEVPVQKKRIYELQQVSHDYTRISGVDGKVRQLLSVGQAVVAATSMGIYEVYGGKATPIAVGKNVTFAEAMRLNSEGLMFGTDRGAFLLERKGSTWVLTNLVDVDNQQILSIVQLSSSQFIVTTEFDVFILKRNSSGLFDKKAVAIPDQGLSAPVARLVKGTVVVFTLGKAFEYNAESENFFPSNKFLNFKGIVYSQKGYTWLRENGTWQCYPADTEVVPLNSRFLGLLENPISIYVNDDRTINAVNGYAQLYRFGNEASLLLEKEISAFVMQIATGDNLLLNPNDINLDYNSNSLKISVSAPAYLADGGVAFQSNVAGLTRGWTDWNNSSYIDFPYFPAGKYTIMVRARDSMGRVSNIVQVNFEVKPPFTQTPLFFILCAVVAVVLIVLVVKYRERSLQREKEILEQKVTERTKTIEEQKEVLVKQRDELELYNHEILQQKEEIETQRDEIEIQRDQIFKQNDEITKSIAYAKRIQTAVMPSNDMVAHYLPKSFVLFRPRDIVSGDFYWMSKRKDKVVVVAADCTGHGVPGAFMSMMGVGLLNDIVNVTGEVEPQIILNELRNKIKATLWQSGKESETARDGMDVAVCVVDLKAKKLFYSGAYNSLYFFRNRELTEVKADKMPVGIHISEKDSFTLHEIDILPGDRFYIASDGYVSQFGGDIGKKYMAKPFKDLLTAIQHYPISNHQQMLEDNLDRWQGAYDQVDDILVIGVEV
jgi:serine phosphatase RsbU (regulator of sigma subunit)/ligand-binding sensor domain-containing protein